MKIKQKQKEDLFRELKEAKDRIDSGEFVTEEEFFKQKKEKKK